MEETKFNPDIIIRSSGFSCLVGITSSPAGSFTKDGKTIEYGSGYNLDVMRFNRSPLRIRLSHDELEVLAEACSEFLEKTYAVE